MLTIIEYLDYIEKATEQLKKETQLLKKYYHESVVKNLVRAGKRGAHISSGLYLSYRGLLLCMKDAIPALPGLDMIFETESKLMDISVEKLAEFDSPVYKISLPILLPNKRRQSADYNNAVTVAVRTAVERFCNEHHVRPFDRATMIILTYGGNPRLMVDDDNKEASVIQNGMIWNFLIDDSPGACNNAYYFKRVDQHKDYRTEIYVVDSDHDLEVLKMIKSLIK